MHADHVDWGERAVAAVFLLLGVGILLPWNAFISAKPYFESRLCSAGKNEKHSDVELWFGLVFNVSSVLALGLILGARFLQDFRQKRLREIQGTQVPTNESQELPGVFNSRDDDFGEPENPEASSWCNHEFFSVVLPLLVYLAVFLVTTVMVLFPNILRSAFLGLTLAGLALCGMSCAVAGAGVIATAGRFPHGIGINAYFSGQAIGGVAVSLANLISATLEDPDTFWHEQCQTNDRRVADEEPSASCVPYSRADWSTFTYFALGCVVLGACIVGYLFVERSDVAARLVLQEQDRRSGLHSDLQIDGNLTTSSRSGIELPHQPQIQAHAEGENRSEPTPETLPSHLESYQDTLSREGGLAEDTDCQSKELNGSVATGRTDEDHDTTLSVLKAVRGPAMAIWLTFFVTLALFPSWTSRLESVHKCHSSLRLYNDLFMPVTFVLFNAGDLTGRLLSAKVKVEHIRNLSRKLVLVATGRLMFVPLFLICLATGSAFNEIAFGVDAFSVMVQFAFAVTNGLIVSIAFMHAPSLIPQLPHVQETSAALLNFALVLGLLCGSLASFPFIEIATER